MSDTLDKLKDADPHEHGDNMLLIGEAIEEIERLQAKVERLEARGIEDMQRKIKRLEGCLQEFVDRRDRGEIVSTYTYNKFKQALEQSND